MYLLILKVLVYYQLLRVAQDSRRDVQKDLDELRNWYYRTKKPQFQQQEKTIEDLKMTIQNLTNEKVNRTPNNNNNNDNHSNNNDNHSNNYIIIVITI